MGFYNVQQGDAPYFKSLADTYSMSDNFHQSVNGGTGANHIMLGHGDAIWFSDGNGHPAFRRTTSKYKQEEQTQGVSWMKSRIRIQPPAPTIGTPRMVTAAARLVQPPTAADLTPTAQTPLSPE
jgi:phospholipase C